MRTPMTATARAMVWMGLATGIAHYAETGWFEQTLAALPPTAAMQTKIVVGAGVAACLVLAGFAARDMDKAMRPAPKGGEPSNQAPAQG